MKIKKMIIENFRCYLGRQEIDFNTDGRVTLIYGLSGAGKTSFLQFINWVFYNKRNFVNKLNSGETVQDKPIFNEHITDNLEVGEKVKVEGIIDFVHDGIDYSIARTIYYSKGVLSLKLESESLNLTYYNDGSWVSYNGDIPSKINEMIPISLSKYFFFHGEKMDILNNKDQELKSAIFNIFGLAKFENAINHLGSKTQSTTVLYKYYTDMSKSLKSLGNSNPNDILNQIRSINTLLEECVKAEAQCEKSLSFYTKRINDHIEKIGVQTNSDDFKQSINTCKSYIENLELYIQNNKYYVGQLFYKTIPFKLLSKQTDKCIRILTEEAENFELQTRTVFKNLRKDLLMEILEKGECICGDMLSENNRKYIQATIDSMPPDNYTYQLKQFREKSKYFIDKANTEFISFDKYMSYISKSQGEINDKYAEIENLNNKLKKIDSTKDYAYKIEEDRKRSNDISTNLKITKAKIAKFRSEISKLEKDYKSALDAQEIKDEFKNKIEFLEKCSSLLQQTFNSKVKKTTENLEKSILEVYKKLSTRVENYDKIKFLNDDFSLRRVNRTGGQEVIDVYSYIIGMINALHHSDIDEDKDFPIIIDAPFSHTDSIQATHVFETLPRIAPQVIILTLELDKFKNCIDNTIVGNYYKIKSNDTQTITTIERGNINDIKW